MVSEEPVQPLRLSGSSTKNASAIPRPLSEISSAAAEKRRNSPSYQANKVHSIPHFPPRLDGRPITDFPRQKIVVNTDSSPFQSSPLDSTTSPRLFWQNRSFNSENDYNTRSGSPSPTRRSSIERLQKASRVKNSNILALEQKNEYDPTRLPHIERPLAKVQGNAFGGTGLSPLRSNKGLGHQRSESSTSIPIFSPPKTTALPQSPSSPVRPTTPSKEQVSPMKSSLSSSRFKSSFDPETGTWSTETSTVGGEEELPEGRTLHRHAKSVTFDAAPPQVNEYEMATPDLSSIGSNSREGSYDSYDDDDDDHYMMHDGHSQDDSFDASLEDTDKTPVVGPDDWRHDGHESDAFDRSPRANDVFANPQRARAGSTASNGDHRPLPPLPGAGLTRSNSNASNGLSATAERMLGAHRSLPSPPPAASTKSEIQNIGTGKMTLEERLKLMMLSDDGKSAAEQQRERRMRRANGPRERSTESQTPEREARSPRSPSAGLEEDEGDDVVGELSGLEEYELPPRISRESILRRVNGNNKLVDRESDYNFSSPPPGSSPDRQFPLDPDVPIPSTEQDDSYMNYTDDESIDESIVTKGDHEEKRVDVHSLPDAHHDKELEANIDNGRGSHDNDTDSQYSDEPSSIDPRELSDDSTSTPRAGTPVDEPPAPTPPPKDHESNLGDSMELPTESTIEEKIDDFSKGLESFMLTKPEEPQTMDEPEKSKAADVSIHPQRPLTPEHHIPRKPLSKPEYDGSGWGEPEDEEEYEEEPGTPESVIHRPMVHDSDYDDMEEDDEPEPSQEVPAIELPAVPEQLATIKSASGSKLKTRPSATPSDIVAMREQRRQVSREVPMIIPPIPERHRNRLSQNLDGTDVSSASLTVPGSDFLDRHPSFKNRSLTLEIDDLDLSLEKDFERVIEAQKVAFYPRSHYDTAPALSSNYDFVSGQVSGASAAASADNEASSTAARAQTIAGSVQNSNKSDANVTTRKQRGYLMRQNTKLVAASDKDSEDLRGGYRSAGNSPVKQAAMRPQSWTVEPWNGQPRKRSLKKNRPPLATGPVPPLPGQESNAQTTGLNPLTEEDASSEITTGEESGERGRLFVKVMGVKDLDLPIPKSEFSLFIYQYVLCELTIDSSDERTWFSLTLDNGVHCVTTAWLELARNAPIGQEFELVVPNDLEFQLTLNVKLEKPPAPPVVAAPKKLGNISPTKALTKPKTSTFSRVFASPKKRKEMELMRQREEEEHKRMLAAQQQAQQREREALQSRQRNAHPSAWELLSPLAAEDGSFARSYVCLKEHEARCFGRPYLVDVACFNEWATEEAGFASSVKSKRGTQAVVRRAPYKIGKLELQLLFVPRPKGATDDDMPKSMNSCIREMKAAEERLAQCWEGHLSQQGGDCPVSLEDSCLIPLGIGLLTCDDSTGAGATSS